MKKTLITMAVLAVAPAAYSLELSEAVFSEDSLARDTYDVSGVSGDFTLTLSLDAQALVSLFSDQSKLTTVASANVSSTTNYVVLGGASSANYGGLYTSKDYDLPAGTGVTLANANGNRTSPGDVSGYSRLDSLRNVSAASYTAATLTMSVAAIHDDNPLPEGLATKGTLVVLSLTGTDGTVSNYAGTVDGLKWTSGDTTVDSVSFNRNLVERAYLFDNAVGVSDAVALNAAVQAVPEPATATLSLLALAGLAARRRRK